MRKALTSLIILGFVPLALGHLGRWLPLGDSLAVFRPQLLAGLALCLGLLALGGARWRALVLALPVVASATQMGWHWRGPAPRAAGEITLYQKNLLWLGRAPEAVLADIRATQPDVITFQETSDENGALTEALMADYPHHLICRGQRIGGVSLFSRWPIEGERPCDRAEGLALVKVRPDGGAPFWLGSLHLSWPWPHGQAQQAEEVAAAIAGLDAPLVLAGDFNMVPWGAALRRIAVAGGLHRAGGYVTSFPRFGQLVPLPIDHVLIPEGGGAEVTLRPLNGSDHHGLLARIDLGG